MRTLGTVTAFLLLLLSASANAAFDNASLPGSGPLTVERVTPEGDDVPPGKQIVIAFNRPVVPIGRMDRTADEIPVTITPPLECQWRWISTRTLACNLEDKKGMQPSTAYKVEIRPGIKAIDGTTIAQPATYNFITQRARVRFSTFRIWTGPVHPVLRVVWDQPVTQKSAADHLYFVSPGHDRMPVKLSVDGELREIPGLLGMPGEKRFVRTKEEEQASDDDLHMVNGQEARRVWLAEPASALPADAPVNLHVEPGLVSALGVQPGIENRDIVTFNTFPGFALKGIHCTNNADKDVRIAPGETQKPEQYCNPMRGVSLEFSAPVARREARDHMVFNPSFGSKSAAGDVWGDIDGESSEVVYGPDEDRSFSVHLPYGLKPAQTYTFSVPGHPLTLWDKIRNAALALMGKPVPAQSELADKFGRHLGAPVSMSFTTDHRIPNLLLDYSAAVLERKIDSEVPVYVNNLKRLDWTYSRLTTDGAKSGLRFSADVPNVQDIQFAVPANIRRMIGDTSGALWGKLSSDPVIEHYRNKYEPEIFVEVTPYQVHAKLGHFNTLVWVTDLANGQPVADATVEIYKDALPTLAGPGSDTIKARTGADGLATLPGTETIDPQLLITRQWDKKAQRYFVRVSKGRDMALLPIWDEFLIDSYRSSGTSFYPENRRKFGHMETWGTSAQGIYHPGDTIQYKIYVRNQDNKELTPPPAKGYWLEVIDPAGKVVQTVKDITLSEFGGISGELPIGKKALVGWYNFRLKANFTQTQQKNDKCKDAKQADEQSGEEGDENEGGAHNECARAAEFTWTPLRVLVSDFTPVPFAVRNQLNGDLFHSGDQVGVSTDAKLHSGGPYTQAQARITAILAASRFTSKNPAAKDFTFGSEEESTETKQIFQTTTPLDEKGEQKSTFVIDEKKIYHGRITIESAVQDDRGKFVAHEAYADYVGVDRFAGLHLAQWFYSVKDDIAPDFVVTDERGVPVKDAPITLTLERKDRTAARVKSAGNSYVPETQSTMVKEGECKETSALSAKACHFKVTKAGEYKLRASVTDSKGRTQETVTDLWISGPGYVMWDDGSDAWLDIVPDRETYHVGDTAHFLVKNPYPGAKALVTVERYGVIDHFEMTLADSTAVIDLPIKPDYLPGFYLSVNVTSPRVDKAPDAGQVDLGKPTFRIGYARVPVRDAYKEITVTATPDKDTYRPGDTVHVKLKAVANHAKKEPVELTVAVLDEAVFDLIAGGRSYYDPYGGFYNLGGLDLRNYSLLTRLVGRQKFEKKGANPGGDGGSSLNMRSLFKYVSYWNPSLKTDADGNADIEFAVPDNLTGWHLFVLADTPSDRFGLGENNFKVNRPTEIRPEMPNQVTENDNFEARFSVMNRTKENRTINVSIKAEGDIDGSTPGTLEKTIALKPFERQLVVLPLEAGKVGEKRDVEDGRIRFTVTAGDAMDRDGVTHQLPVHKMRSLDVAANYGTTEANRVEEPIQFPENIYPDVGAVSVVLSPTVIGNLEGAFRYIRDYPYPCWEQVLTRGVMAAHYKNLREYMSAHFVWPNADKLPDDTLARAGDYQAPNGGMTYFLPFDQYADPYLSAYTALGFNWLRHSGYKIPETVEKKLHDYLLNFLRNESAPDYYSDGMKSTVRAVALAALAESHEIDASDIERYAPFVKDMSLFGKAHFAQAAMQVKGEEKQAVDAAKAILAHANETGGKFVFSEELDDGYTRILSSPLRENCAILDMFVQLGETPYGKNIGGDVPFKLVRAITQTRGGRDHWENTQENMFCMNALIDYSRVYEKTKPNMKLTASLDAKPFGATQFTSFRDDAVTFERPIENHDVGRKAMMELTRNGDGRVYYATRLTYALRDQAASDTDAGIQIHREYSIERNGKWELLTAPYSVKQGDVVRVDLFVSVPAARNFVVVDDPVPGGFEPVNDDLANTSKIDAAKAEFQAAGGSIWFKYNDWSDYNVSRWSFYHKELLHNAARFYADYLPAGNYHLSYAAQAIGAGQFAVMPAMASEMYDPDVYGKTGLGHLNVATNLPSAP